MPARDKGGPGARVRALEQRTAAAMAQLVEVGDLCGRADSTYEECLAGLLDAAIAVTGANMGNLQLIDDASGSLVIAAQRGCNVPFLRFFGRVATDENSACAAALASGHRIIVEDVTKSEIFASQPALAVMLQAGAQAVQSTPLVSSAGVTLGMVSTHFRRPHRPDDRELQLIDLLARQAANYLERRKSEEVLRSLDRRRLSRAEALTAAGEERFGGLLEAAPDAMIIVNDVGTIDLVNTQTEVLFGYSHTELIGRPIEILLPDRFHARHVHHRAGFFANPRTRSMGSGLQLYGRRKDRSEFPVEVSLSSLQTQNGILAFSAVRDITERVQQQEALEQSQAALAQAQKMEAVGQLTGGIAHDFNNLLTAIHGSIELVFRGRDDLDPEIKRLLTSAMRAAERGGALTHQLLAFSRQQTLAPQDIDINRRVAGMAEMLRRTLGESIEIETMLAAGLWHCFVDPNHLESTLVNLAVNARDAMPDGGKLRIETGNTFIDEEYATQQDVTPGQYVMLAVSDSGVGMTAETIAHAFEPVSANPYAIADPCATMERAQAQDPELERLANVLYHWNAALGAQAVTASEVIEIAIKQHNIDPDGKRFVHDAFRDALLAVAGSAGNIDSRRLGNWLSGNQDRIVNGKKIVLSTMASGYNRWQLVHVHGSGGHEGEQSGSAPPMPLGRAA